MLKNGSLFVLGCLLNLTLLNAQGIYKFYGMTSSGGRNDGGVIFEWSPANNSYTKKQDFDWNNGAMPQSGLTYYNGKFYGTTLYNNPGYKGVIFVWNPATNTYTKKHEFNGENGANPSGNLILYNGKFYGMTSNGGTNEYGVIFEWDPVTNTFTKKYDFIFSNGIYPTSSLTLYNGKFYGLASDGGTNGSGVIFEWDPATNTYTKKYDFIFSNGRNPNGSLTLYNDKFYGMTTYVDGGGKGSIFEWDPVTNTYTKKHDFIGRNGAYPYGNLTLNNGKLYGMATEGGDYDEGVIFEWDPASNAYTKKQDFIYSKGSSPFGSLTLYNGKFYGMTNEGGDYGAGVLFEWDPIGNNYTVKINLDYYYMGGYPFFNNNLTVLEAPVAQGMPGICNPVEAVTINGSNNYQWVPIVDASGNAIAEINANGNNLGLVSTSLYVHNAGVREDANRKLYLNRSISISPTVQPNTPVDIRLYIKGTELEALKAAQNSLSQPSGVTAIEDMVIVKNADNCSGSMTASAVQQVTGKLAWGSDDYVLTASISSFSSFYFAKGDGVLPLTLLEFNGQLKNNETLLSWKTDNEQNTAHFEIERSGDGRSFVNLGMIGSANKPGVHNYDYIDQNVSTLNAPVIYYRLKQVDLDGRFTYSKVIAIKLTQQQSIVQFYPNPVIHEAGMSISVDQVEKLNARIMDQTGRVLKQQQWQVLKGSSYLKVDTDGLLPGMYYLELKGKTINEVKQFVKQ